MTRYQIADEQGSVLGYYEGRNEMAALSACLGREVQHNDVYTISEAYWRSLEDLEAALKEDDPAALDRDGAWCTNLPTFGGEEPANTAEIWSWDETRLLMGTCADDLEIVDRKAWEQ